MKFFPTSFRSTSFKAVLLGCVAAAPIAMSVGAHAGVNDPPQLLYVFPGVYDSGNTPFIGSAALVHCTNVGGTTEKLQIIVLQFTGGVVTNNSFTTPTAQTFTAETHAISTFAPDTNLATGAVDQGVLLILGTSINFHCTAMDVSASATTPTGISLQGLRYNPIPGTQF